MPSLRAASRRATTTAWAVGSFVSWTRSWARATIASSTTATAAMAAPRGSRQLRLGERLAHEQLVVHGRMLADAHRRSSSRAATEPQPAGARPAALGFRRCGQLKRIAILTGGGDVPGLNAVIKSVVYRATEAGYDVLGIRRGWEGLTHVQPDRRRPGLPPPARPDQHADDRPDRRDDPAHLADEPAQDARGGLPPGWTPRPAPASRSATASTT